MSALPIAPRPGPPAGQAPAPGVSAAELGRQELLRGVDPAALVPFLSASRILHLETGEVLIEAGRTSGELYLLLEGTLGVHLGGAQEPALLHVEAGETTGELSLIDGKPGSAHVIAATPCRILALDEEIVWLLVNTFHAVSTNLLFTLARRLRHGNALICEDRQQLRRYRFQATVDGLTELFNRHWLDLMLPRQVERSRRSHEPLCLVMLDIDHFKQVNDEFGHPVGDEVIRQVARGLRGHVRALDLPARYGGEEFVLICPDTTADAARALAERLRRAIADNPVSAGPHRLSITVSCGIAELQGGESAESLVRRTDDALYRAKRSGRNRVSV